MSRMLRSVAFMVVVCAVCTALPAIVRAATARRVATNERMATCVSVLSVLGLPVNPDDHATTERTFRGCVREEIIEGRKYWFGLEGPATGVVAFAVEGPGFWGPIHGIVAVSERDKSIVGLAFTRHEETPGLGGRIAEPWFTEQFRGITLNPRAPDAMVRLVREAERTSPSDVDAITGASETSRKIQRLFDVDVRQALLTLSNGARS